MKLTKEEKLERKKQREKRKLKSLKDKVNETKGLLTDKEVFCSFEMNEYISKKVNRLLKSYSVPPVMIRMSWNKAKSAFVARTNNSVIEINAGHSLTDAVRPEKLEMVLGLSAHEASHILFTNFLENKRHVNGIISGELYPAVPAVPAELEDNLKALLDFLEGKRGLVSEPDPKSANRSALASVRMSLSNILEDPRVENLFAVHCSLKNRVLYGGLLKILDRQLSICAPLPEIVKKIKSGKMFTFEALMQVMLHYGRFGEIKGFNYKVHRNEPFIKKFFEIQGLVDSYIASTSAADTLNYLNLIIVTLFHEIEEYILEVYKDMPDGDSVSSEIENRSSKLDGTTSDNISDNISSGIGDELSKSMPGEDGESLSHSDENSEIDLDSERAEEREELNSTCYRKDSKIKNDLNTYQEDESVTLTQEKTNTKIDLDSISSMIAKARTTAEMEREIEKDLAEFTETIDFGDIHKNISKRIIRHNVTEENKRDYERLAPKLLKIAQQMARKSDYFMEEDAPIEISGKYSGTRFKASTVAKGNYKNFARDYALEPKPKIAIAVRVDESGSMSGNREMAAKATALLIYMFCHIVGISVAIYGDDTSGRVNLFCYTDFDTYEMEDDKYRLCNISAGGCNRDGFAIRYLKERLAEQVADKKLMIVISDGQPSDTGGYCGPAAIADIQQVCRECDREGIGYIAAAIGDDKEDIKAIYGERHFLDISDLNALPVKLTGLIKRLMR